MSLTSTHQQTKSLADITYIIGGVIYTTAMHDAEATKGQRIPVAGATVEIQDHARVTQTDQQGRFRFANLVAGLYTLLVTTQAGAVGQREIQVPPTYDVEVKPPIVTLSTGVTPVTAVAPSPSAPPRPLGQPQTVPNPADNLEVSVAPAAEAGKPKRNRSKKQAEPGG